MAGTTSAPEMVNVKPPVSGDVTVDERMVAGWRWYRRLVGGLQQDDAFTPMTRHMPAFSATVDRQPIDRRTQAYGGGYEGTRPVNDSGVKVSRVWRGGTQFQLLHTPKNWPVCFSRLRIYGTGAL